MLADAGAPAVLALAPLAIKLADAGAPTFLALAPAAVMLADAGAPAVLVDAPDTVMVADVCEQGSTGTKPSETAKKKKAKKNVKIKREAGETAAAEEVEREREKFY
jgi:hypothetical protein